MQRQLGFNLLEVMIALVIISVGVLGLAGLQLTSLKQNQSAYMRSQATTYAYDIADRMRANMSQVNTGGYFVASGAVSSSCINYLGDATGCSAAAMASHDIAEWQNTIATELINGSGRVCRSDLSGDQPGIPDCEADNSANPIVVYVWWQDDRSSGDLTQFAVSVEL